MREQFKIWEMNDNPFLPLPPQDETERKNVFVGRNKEIEIILSRANRAQGLFIFGMFGIGKTMLALEVLRRLKRTRSTLFVKFKKKLALVSSILLEMKVSSELSSDPLALLGSKMSKNHAKKPMMIVVDDLDKDTDIGDMQKIIIESRQVIELGIVLILLGHPIGVTAELSSADDILYAIPLSNLSNSELAEMIKRYLSISRMRKYAGNPFFPFSLDIVEMLTRIISEYNLTPRIMNHACRLLLDQAALDKVTIVDTKYFLCRWPFIAQSCLHSLRQEDREYFRIIHEAGSLNEDTRGLIKEIGGEFAEYAKVRKTLEKLIQGDILIEDSTGGKKIIKPNILFDGHITTIIR